MYYICLLWPSAYAHGALQDVSMCKALVLKFSRICPSYLGDHNLNKLKSECFHTSFSTSGQMVYEKRVFTRFFSYVLWSTGSMSLYWPICRVVKLCLGLEPTLVERFCNSNNLIDNKVFTVFAQLLNKY